MRLMGGLDLFDNMLPILGAVRKKDRMLCHAHTLCVKVVKSGTWAMWVKYTASFSSSRSAIASAVWAFLNGVILRPSLGFNAKLRL